MPGKPVTLIVPDDLYDRLQQQAAQARRSLEEELLETVATVLRH
jgi:hypothetical protein